MSEHQNAPQQPRSGGLIATLLSLPGQLIAALPGALLLSLLAEWLGITLVWPEQGAEHAHQLMSQELRWFSDNVIQSIVMADPTTHLELALEKTYQWLFVDTGLASWLAHTGPTGSATWRYWSQVYLQASVYIVLTFVLRLFILLLTAPMFILTTLLGVVDGLVRRDIRRFGSGYESGFIYHHARRAIRPVFLLPWMVYLALPFSVHPDLILLPAAGLLGLVVSVAVGSFKKYI
ncbi:TPA: TIGR03747 family integrating conjugative element membrane protein [Klebsiella aerogenes]|nr:TIGR03747 family integrating conjugative element membrane protein [Klebsiella aerogenes]